MVVTIIGIGLIGGSLALNLKELGIASKIIGIDKDTQHQNEALKLNLVDEISDWANAIEQANLIILAIPVDVIPTVAIRVLNQLRSDQLVMDMGSTKSELCELISQHPLRHRFVPTHPMWGTEKSGPQAAQLASFSGRTAVICEREKSDQDAIELVTNLYKDLGMSIKYMEAEEHDMHTAYVSHISHLTSFALSLTVLEKEREEEHIFDLAGGGFDSTVRLAKSSPQMWVPIFMQNKYNILDVLREHIHQLQVLKKMIERDDEQALRSAMIKANSIKRIIK